MVTALFSARRCITYLIGKIYFFLKLSDISNTNSQNEFADEITIVRETNASRDYAGYAQSIQ